MTAGRARIIAAVIAASALALPGVARADGPSDLEAALAEPVVTTASQSAEDQSLAPATVTTITSDDLRRYGMKTLADAINFLSLGMVAQNNLDDVEVGARGVQFTGDYGDHVLLLIDGHAVNEQWDGTAYFGRGAGVPMELVDHIEVILGPGSVLYGSQAMLGVINIVTKRAKDFDGLHFVAESELFTSGRGAVGFGKEFTLGGKRAELTYEVEYYGQSGPAFTLGPQNYDFTGPGTGSCFNATRMGSSPCTTPGIWGGTPSNNSYWTNLPDGYLRFLWGNFELDLHAESYKRSDPAYSYVGYNVNNSFEHDRFLSADIRHRWAINSTAQLRSRLYGDAYTYEESLPAFASFQCAVGQNSCVYQGTGYSRWVGLEEQLALDWFHDQSLTTMVGVDGRATRLGEANASDDINLDAGGPPPTGVFTKSEYRLAVYGQQTWRPLRWLFLNVGARLDEDFHVDDNVQFGHLSPRAVAAITPWHNGTVKVIYSEAYRAPTYFETNFTDNQTSIPNLGLGPETVQSEEVSFEQRVGTQRFFVGGFDAQYSSGILGEAAPNAALLAAVKSGTLPPVTPNSPNNIISTYGPANGDVQQFQNVGSISNIGVNAAFEGTLLHRDLRYGANFTWAYSRLTEPNPSATAPGPCPGATGTAVSVNCTLPITVSPQVFGNARISYDIPGDWPVIGMAVAYMGRRPINNAFDSGWSPIPYAPPQVDIRATISGPVPRFVGLSYRLMADYAVSAVTPYAMGPVTDSCTVTGNCATDNIRAPLLVPVDTFRTTVGVQYDWR
jgi:outer membrane receptor for ferrienterochelin and colicins